jgi:hypothetical protein
LFRGFRDLHPRMYQLRTNSSTSNLIQHMVRRIVSAFSLKRYACEESG